MAVLRIATRSSRLAVRQAELVADAIRRPRGGLTIELLPVATRGDRHAGSLSDLGGKGLFTRELEDALRRGQADLAVHSAKDLPATMAEDFVILACPPREDARDAIVRRAGALPAESAGACLPAAGRQVPPASCSIASSARQAAPSSSGSPPAALPCLPAGATVGTSSLRRRAQLLALRPDLGIVPIRGNVDTRVRKALDAGEGTVDAVVLAMAGLRRIGLDSACAGRVHPLSVEEVIPAAGQGILAVQALAARADLAEPLAAADDPPSRQALLAERTVVAALGAHCRSCLAVHVARDGGAWRGWAMAARPDGSGMIRLVARGLTAGDAAAALLRDLLDRGGRDLIHYRGT